MSPRPFVATTASGQDRGVGPETVSVATASLKLRDVWAFILYLAGMDVYNFTTT